MVTIDPRSSQMTPFVCEIRVGGSVPTDVLEELDGMQVIIGTEETVLRGTLADQSALIGVINRLQGRGIDLREIRPTLTGPSRGDRNPELETVLQGPVPDRATLITIIGRLQGVGIALRGLRQLGPGDLSAGPGAPGPRRHGSAVPGYEIRTAGGIGPVVAACLQEFDITIASDRARAHLPPRV
jgi:hypothetical protein